jgi:peptide/nickel transport system ATP-binding protein
MDLGEIVEHGRTEDVFEPPYHPSTEPLLSAIPDLEDDGDRILLERNVSYPFDVPSGCRFHPRCPRKIGEVCEREDPTDNEVDGETIGCHRMREEYADEVDWSSVD